MDEFAQAVAHDIRIVAAFVLLALIPWGVMLVREGLDLWREGREP